MADFDVVIIGAGVVGLACGQALSAQGLSVVVLERETMIASITSARNSEVIHAGLYYPQNSLKHLLCLRGRQLLYQFADQANIAYKKCGKLVVATSDQEQDKIEALYAQAEINGVENIRLLTQAQVSTLEPQIQSTGGLFSAETGIIDAHGFCQALAYNIEVQGGIIALNTPFLHAEPCAYGFKIFIGGSEKATISSHFLVNSGGLDAANIARRIDGLPLHFCPQMTYAKGSYFSLGGKPPFSHLVYPAPVEGGLGVHATLDLAGRVRFGPDVEWLEQFPKSVKRLRTKNCGENNKLEQISDSIESHSALTLDGNDDGPSFDYRVDTSRAQDFYAAIRRYWPQLPDGALLADYAGVRPKLSGRGQPQSDFLIEDVSTHGVSGLVNLFGIESPGLTASLAIGEEIAQRLKSQK